MCVRPLPDANVQLIVKVNRRPAEAKRKDDHTMYFSGESTLVKVQTYGDRLICVRAITGLEDAVVTVRMVALVEATEETKRELVLA